MSQPHGAGQCDREIIIIVRWSDGGCFQASAASVWPSGSSPGGSPRPPQARTYHRRALQGCGAFPDRRGCGSNNVRNTGHFFLFSLVPDLDHIGVYVNTRQTERTVEREQRAKKKKNRNWTNRGNENRKVSKGMGGKRQAYTFCLSVCP